MQDVAHYRLRWLILVFTLYAHINLHASEISTQPWQKLSEEDGISIFYREDTIPGKHWIRGVVTDSVRIDVVGQVLLDVASYPKWMEQLRESRIVQAQSPSDYILYNYYDLPWPLWDRDIYVHVVIQRDTVHHIVTANIDKYDSPKFPPIPKVIRVPAMQGSLKLESLSPQVTRGEFTELLDMGGTIPEWAKTYLSKQTPAYILSKVREACMDSFYIRSAPRCSSISKGCP